ncbi:MAG: TRAP transporter small permease [Bradyrhizobiaceae bacterium]|nr:TRAP transporter small permease [Bradyrhizobiaceae bacterium]
MNRFIGIVEKTAGYFIALLAAITVCEAILRYVFNAHIPDGFVVGQIMQGIAICWGIATATYADRHITVDIAYEFGGRAMRRTFDVFGYTLNLLFLALFGYAMTFKVFDILQAGQVSAELLIPIWIGYSFASIGILVAVIMGAIRWWQVVIQKRLGSGTAENV